MWLIYSFYIMVFLLFATLGYRLLTDNRTLKVLMSHLIVSSLIIIVWSILFYIALLLNYETISYNKVQDYPFYVEVRMPKNNELTNYMQLQPKYKMIEVE